VVYFNGDSNGKGRLQVGASPSLSAFLEEVARDVAARTEKEWRVTPLGSGSDYVPFLHHTGIAAANLGYSGEDAGGVYHSVFDSLAWYKRFSDGTFAYGKALAEFMAVAVARMSDAPLPPFQFTRLASTIQSWWVEVSRIADDKKVVLPVAEARAAIQKMASLASAFESAYAGGAPTEESARAIYLLERNLLLTESGGLPGRPWYRHALSAPGQYTGYGAKTLPGVREALELDRPDEARSQALILVRCFDRFNRALEAAIAKLRQSKASD
jgi:N-acetylated-alpha-linked acidic dipeptidase